MYNSCYYRVLRVYQTTFTLLKASYDRGMTSVAACSRTASVVVVVEFVASMFYYAAMKLYISKKHLFILLDLLVGSALDAQLMQTFGKLLSPKWHNRHNTIYSLSNVNVARFTGSFNFDDQTCTSQNPSR